MIKSPDCVKRFHSARVRFLKGALNSFFKREFPKLIGPILRNKQGRFRKPKIRTRHPNDD